MEELKNNNIISSGDIQENEQEPQPQNIIIEDTKEDIQDDCSQRMTPISKRLQMSRQKRRLTRLIQVTSEKEIQSQDFHLMLEKTTPGKINQQFENKLPFKSFSGQQLLHPSGSIKTVENETQSASSFQTSFVAQVGQKQVQNKTDFPTQISVYEVMDYKTYEFKMIKYCQIRQNKTLAQLIRAETPWTVDIGIFKDYLKESSSQLYTSCFEEDWNTMKKLKYKISQEADVKQAVFKAYSLLKDTYKYQAGVSPFGNLFAIGSNQCSIFVNEVLDCLDIDKEGNLKTSDADRMFITVNAARSGPFNPANGMIRCQLIEFVIRCAIEKFFVSKIEENELNSINRFLNEFVFTKCQGFNQTIWRQKNTFNVYVDNIMKAYTKLWNHIYARYSGKHAKPGCKPFMMYDEFNSFVEQSGLLNNELPARDSSVIFNLSMLTQVDELNKSRHLEAKQVEFMEMITRLCNQSSLAPLTKEQIAEGYFSSTMSLSQRENQSLQSKIENAIPFLLKNSCDSKFRVNFQHPIKDLKKNLYILSNGKFF